MELLPAIDLRGGQCVRLRQGDYQQETVFGNHPVEMAKHWEELGATRLHLVDLDGAKAGKPSHLKILQDIVQSLKIPCELGGGLRTSESIQLMLEEVGIDRVIIGTQALKDPAWFRTMVEKYPQRVALGLDARDGMVSTAGWLEDSQTSAYDLAKQFQGLPLAAIIYTNIANDGMMQGVDTGTLESMKKLLGLKLPLIASGGVTTLEDVRKLKAISLQQPLLIGAIIGRALYEGTIQLPEALLI